jgi:chromosome segregation ATPase
VRKERAVTKSEYQELVEFLSEKFKEIDQRFEQIDGRLGRHESRFDSLERELRHVRVATEQNGDRIRLLAEGFTSLDEKVDHFREDVDRRFDGLEVRFDGLEARVDQNRVLIERNPEAIQ